MSSEPTVRDLDSKALACFAARAVDDKKATDTLVIEVGPILAVVEYFVITSAANRRLVRSLADEVEGRIREETGRSPLRVEGAREQQWVLIDYGDVVVHVFSDETRSFYEIERLYRDAPFIDWADSPASTRAADA